MMRRRRLCKIAGSRKGLYILLGMLPTFYGCWLLSVSVEQALMPPPPPDQSLHQFRANRSLVHYFDNINFLIEPSSTCESQKVPVIILVTSAPSHSRHRDVIRNTWGKYQQTYFFLGLSTDDEQLADTYIEAKQYSDIVVHELQEHYQNLTLKVALMLQWCRRRCPHAEFVFKTDDDVIVNPWTLEDVLADNKDAALFGIYLSEILSASLHVPLINMEDVYFTYLVAKRTLGLTLTHDRRLSPYKPWTGFACPYMSLASVHSVTPDEVDRIWPKIEGLSKIRHSACHLFSYISNDLLLY